ncbi:MAG: FKBP-type peptidyl-prolyl cis-trans isomerase [Planctomycetota bacterium]
MVKKAAMKWCFAGIAIVVFGCRSTAPRDADTLSELASTEASTSVEQTPPWNRMTFFERPEFQKGAGPVNVAGVPEFSATDSGLRYRILRPSSGKKPTANNTVKVNYRGWLNSGKVFDSSYERGKATTFPLRSVIAGWTEGMQLVGEGGMIELWVPSNLGYGERGSPGSIPPHSHLHFIVELIDVY